MRLASSTALCWVLSLVLSLVQGVVEPPPQSNNIVVVIADAWRYSAFSGAEKPDSLAVTPRLDSFRRESVDFSRTYSAYPLCTPSRISIQSGLYPSRHNVTKNGAPLALGTPTIALTLSALGFDCAHFGKWHVGGDGYGSSMAMKIVSEPHRHGFGYWEQGVSQPGSGFGDYRHPVLLSTGGSHQPPAGTWEPEFYTDRALAWLRKPERAKKPFFLMLSWRPPHGPWGFEPKQAQQKVMELYTKQLAQGGDLKLRPNMPLRRWEKPQAKDGLLSMMKGYYAATNELDGQFGRVLDAVDSLPSKEMREATAVVFCSDHGEMLESHELTGKGHWYDESARVPLLLRLPQNLVPKSSSSSSTGGSGKSKQQGLMDPLGSDRRRRLTDNNNAGQLGGGGRVYRHAASLTDLYPTLVSLASRGGLRAADQSGAGATTTTTTAAYFSTREHIVGFQQQQQQQQQRQGGHNEEEGGGGGGGGGRRVGSLGGSNVDGRDIAAEVVACARAALEDESCGGGGGSGLLPDVPAEEEIGSSGGSASQRGGGHKAAAAAAVGVGGKNLGAYKWTKPGEKGGGAGKGHGKGGGGHRRGGGGGGGGGTSDGDDDVQGGGFLNRTRGWGLGGTNVTTEPTTTTTTTATYETLSFVSNLTSMGRRLPAAVQHEEGQRRRRQRRRRRLSAHHHQGRPLSVDRVVFSGMPGFWRMATTGVLKVVVTGKTCDCQAERLLLDLEADPFEMRPHKYTASSIAASSSSSSSSSSSGSSKRVDAWYGEEAKRVEAALFAWCKTNRADLAGSNPPSSLKAAAAALATPSHCGGRGGSGSSNSNSGGGGGSGGGARGASKLDQALDASEPGNSEGHHNGGGRHRKPSKLGAGIVKGEKAILHGLPEGTKGSTGRPPALGPTVVFESTDNAEEIQARHEALPAGTAHHHHLRNKDEHGGRDTKATTHHHEKKGGGGGGGKSDSGPQVPWWKKKLDNQKAGA